MVKISEKGRHAMYEKYESPLSSRYASDYMLHLFSQEKRIQTWRKLWVALARAEHKLGLPITAEQVAELEAHIDDIDFDCAAQREKEVRHDVMAHVYAYGKAVPSAAGIIHLGATSCYVTDNGDLILYRDGLRYLRGELLGVLKNLAAFADEYKAMPTLGYTHYQPAQLTTVGKRFALDLQDFVLDLEKVERQIEEIPFRSVKGTTGTQASFLELFDGDHAKCRQLEKNVAKTMGFDKVVFLSGQTYTRKIDYFVLSILSGIAQSAGKMATDVRLLASMKEIEEPFGKSQVGSSAMAYKRNPMRSERVCSLARYVMSLPPNAAMTEATQWFERTLDDSANRRISLPEAFLATDVVLAVLIDIASGFQVWPKVIERHVKAELPFMATENLLMEAVKRGGDRQQLHEVIREHSMEAAKVVKAEGKDNDLLERLKNDPAFASVKDDFDTIVDPAKFVGRAPEQVSDFLAEVVNPILEANAELLKSGVAVDKVNV